MLTATYTSFINMKKKPLEDCFLLTNKNLHPTNLAAVELFLVLCSRQMFFRSVYVGTKNNLARQDDPVPIRRFRELSP